MPVSHHTSRGSGGGRIARRAQSFGVEDESRRGAGRSVGSAFYDYNTDFTNAWTEGVGSAPFDPVAAGWTLVLEPNTALLLSLGP